MKELTGGDNIYIRRLYRESEETYMKTQFVIQTNKTFFVDDTYPAVWSRIRVVKFMSHFLDENEIDEYIKEDPENLKKGVNVFEKNKLINKLIEEISPAFLYIIIDKLKNYKKHKKLPNQDIIKNETDKYRIDMDVLQTFIQKALIKSDNSKIKISQIIMCYNDYIKINHPRVTKLDRRRLEHLLLKIYGTKSIQDDCLMGYNFNEGYGNTIDEIINQLEINK
jgi:phage/plasmid-associated DNA primase